jgi:replication factor A1
MFSCDITISGGNGEAPSPKYKAEYGIMYNKMAGSYIEAARDIENSLPGNNSTSIEEIAEAVEQYHADFNVPIETAKNTVKRKLHNETSTQSSSREQQTDADDVVSLSELSKDDDQDFLTVEGKVIELFTPNSDSIAQSGLISDGTATRRFTTFQTSFEKSPEIEVREGEEYRLHSVVVDYYKAKDNVGIKINKTTTVEEIEKGFITSDFRETGVIVNIEQGSGLIRRCSVDGCNYTLNTGECSEHGNVDGEPELRIKASFDTGKKVRRVVFNQEETTKLTGMTLEEAIDLADKERDTEIVTQKLRKRVQCRCVEIAGNTVGNYSVVVDISQPTQNEIIDEPPTTLPSA